MKILKIFITECMFFTKPHDGLFIKNWVYGIFAWLNTASFCYCILKIMVTTYELGQK